jgi:hypothetical protein
MMQCVQIERFASKNAGNEVEPNSRSAWLHLAGTIVWPHADPRRRANRSEEIEHVHDPEAIHENIPQTERSQIADDDIIFVDPTWLCSRLMQTKVLTFLGKTISSC